MRGLGPTAGLAESRAEKRAGPRNRPGILGLLGKPAGPIVGSQASAYRCHGAGAGAGARQVRWGRLGSQGLRGGRGRGRIIGTTTPPPQGMLGFPRQGLEKVPGVSRDLCLPLLWPGPFVQGRPGAIWPPWFAPFCTDLVTGGGQGVRCSLFAGGALSRFAGEDQMHVGFFVCSELESQGSSEPPS